MKKLKELRQKLENRLKNHKPKLRYRAIAMGVAVFCAILLILGRQWCLVDSARGETYARHLFPIVSFVPITITNLFKYYSVGELLLLPVILYLVTSVVWFGFKLFWLRPHRAVRLIRGALKTGTIVALVFSQFMLMHGLNYTRQPLATLLELEPVPRHKAEMKAFAEYALTNANLLRQKMPTNTAGVFELNEKERRIVLEDTDAAYAKLAKDFPQLYATTTRVRPKQTSLYGSFWSYTHIAGLYNVLLGETTVNGDQPDLFKGQCALHEMAHAKGFAREDEAEAVSFLAGIKSENDVLRYGVYAEMYVTAINALSAVDPNLAGEIAKNESPALKRDLEDYGNYWRKFEGKVAEASRSLNDTYLKANEQKDGVLSYGRSLDILLAWFAKYTPD